MIWAGIAGNRIRRPACASRPKCTEETEHLNVVTDASVPPKRHGVHSGGVGHRAPERDNLARSDPCIARVSRQSLFGERWVLV